VHSLIIVRVMHVDRIRGIGHHPILDFGAQAVEVTGACHIHQPLPPFDCLFQSFRLRVLHVLKPRHLRRQWLAQREGPHLHPGLRRPRILVWHNFRRCRKASHLATWRRFLWHRSGKKSARSARRSARRARFG
jgi:hypothetical protein